MFLFDILQHLVSVMGSDGDLSIIILNYFQDGTKPGQWRVWYQTFITASLPTLSRHTESSHCFLLTSRVQSSPLSLVEDYRGFALISWYHCVARSALLCHNEPDQKLLNPLSILDIEWRTLAWPACPVSPPPGRLEWIMRQHHWSISRTKPG